MTVTISARAFNQDTAGAKRAAAVGPVYITDRGTPTHVLLSVTDYERLIGPKVSVAEAFFWPGAADVELLLPERRIEPERVIDWGEI